MGLRQVKMSENRDESHSDDLYESSAAVVDNGLMLNGYVLYPELLSLILIHVPVEDLLTSCQLVCKTWRQLIDSQSLWRRKAILRGFHIPSCLATHDLSPNAYKMIALKNPFKRNFIVNPYGEDGFKGWRIEEPGRGESHRRHGFRIENPPAGADPLDTVDELKDVATSCFATTYYDCRKQQTIDLRKEGLSSELLRILKPQIYICDWYAARFDCASKYMLKVTLRDENQAEIDSFSFQHDEPQWTGSRWSKVEHTFDNTEAVRYVVFYHEGRDNQFWAGHYGSKMTGSTALIKCQ